MKLSLVALVTCLGMASAKLPAVPSSPKTTAWTSKKAIIETRGGAIVSKDLFMNCAKFAFAGYGVQMALAPSMMVKMNFEHEPTDMEKVWIRGTSASIFAFLYALGQMDSEVAFKTTAIYTFVIGCLYPWNTRFISKMNNLKAGPMGHRFPEALMAVLCGMAAIAQWG